MGKAHNPRRGSMQYWPRKRAKRIYPRVKTWEIGKTGKILGFAGYKAGMTHALVVDNRSKSQTKGEEIFWPVTLVECPPIRILSARFYKKTAYGLKAVGEFRFKADTKGTISQIKKETKPEQLDELIKNADDVRAVVYTQPKLTGIGKKRPEVFEVAIGGNNVTEKVTLIKEKQGKDIHINEAFSEGEQLDIHSVTKGKGYQGPVKRFGVSLRGRKSEKTKRGPGSLGPWKGQGHIMYRVAHAGQMGYHTRTEYNKVLLKIGDKPNEANVKGGYINYGNLKNPYIIIKGSIGGPKKRLVRFTLAKRPDLILPKEAPVISYLSQESKQRV